MLLISVMLSVNLVIIWFMPKRITRSEIYVTWAIVSLIAFVLDGAMGAAFQLYYFFRDKIEFRDVIVQAIAGSYGPIVLNLMPKKITRFVVYTIVWTLLATLIELITVKSHVLNYKHWSIGYSIPFYAVGIVFLRWHLRFIRTARLTVNHVK